MEPKIEINVNKIYPAGISELRVIDVGGSPDLILSLNPGAPFSSVLRDAERLAVAINCKLYVNDVLRRSEIGD